MPIAVMIELALEPSGTSEAARLVDEMLRTTRGFEGNEGVEILVDADDSATWLIFERWRDPGVYVAYREYRSGAGRFTGLAPYVLGTTRRTFEIRECE